MAGEPRGEGPPTDAGAASDTPRSGLRRLRALHDRRPTRRLWSRWFRRPATPGQWSVWAVAGMLVVSFIAGIVYYWGSQAEGEQDYVEVYVTDLPADFTKLEIRVAGVFVGTGDYPLVLDRDSFDLLALRGPSNATRVASGYVPSGRHDEIRIVFHSARAELNGRLIELEIPNSVLSVGHQFGMGLNPSSAFLFDINVDRSVRVSADGLLFEPQVDSVYVHHYGGKPGQSAPGSDSPMFSRQDAKPFTNQSAHESPERQNLEQPNARIKANVGATSPTTSASSSKPRFQWNAPVTSSSAPPGTTTTSPTPTSDDPDEPFQGSLPNPGGSYGAPTDPTDVGGWWAHFKDLYNETELAGERYKDDVFSAVETVGAEVLLLLSSEPIAYILATPGQAQNLSADPLVELVESDTGLHVDLASSRAAIRLPQVTDPVLGLRDGAGNPIDGRGVGVAVIDLGVDGTHPDLLHHSLSPAPAVVANYKVESLFTIELANTDTTSGHGTHVAGIVGGRGVADPTLRGVAPGVKMYAFGIGEVSTTLWGVTALDWVVQNHDVVSPRIRVVTNSWGTSEPSAAIEKLVARLAGEGVVVVFSAGNTGGDGSSVRTSYQCRIPAEGVVCVAATDDQNSGNRDGRLASFSSRGSVASPASWPDVSAPGVAIRSARSLVGLSPLGTSLLNQYTEISGTSMSAPHVAGVAALMLQARPGLSAPQVESLLEETAYAFADGGSYASSSDARYDGSHFAKGHGLVDAYAAVQAAQLS